MIEGRQTELWFTERQTDDVALSLRIAQTLLHEQTAWQELLVVETARYGRMLALDGAVQTTEKDEFIYHEMIGLVPVRSHPQPRRVAIVGGGDGGVVREVLKDPAVQQVTLVEIDPRVTEVARRYFPQIASGLDDPRVELRFEDGIAYIARLQQEVDVLIVDSTDPVGPATGLFGREFYQSAARALRPGGLLVAQTESPYLEPDIMSQALQAMAAVFPKTYLYLASVPTYPSGLWSFGVGSLGTDPRQPGARPLNGHTRYYNEDIHRAAFVLPTFVKELVNGTCQQQSTGE